MPFLLEIIVDKVFILVGGEVSTDAAVAHLEGLGYGKYSEDSFHPEKSTYITGNSCGLIGWTGNKSLLLSECYREIKL